MFEHIESSKENYGENNILNLIVFYIEVKKSIIILDLKPSR